MKDITGWFAVVLSLLLTADGAHSQSFKLGKMVVDVHGFASNGGAVTNHNNYMTMDTSSGSWFGDAAVNLSTHLTTRLYIGAQAYDRKIGKLGEGHLTLDWALADYRFCESFGLRAGKIKTRSGLFNETQDDEFLYTWALMPQAVYPMDLRSNNLAHLGADAYGKIRIPKHGGRLEYTLFWGRVADDHTSGWYYANTDIQYPVQYIRTTNFGGDLRWKTPLPSLTMGFSLLVDHEHWLGNETFNPGNPPYIFLTPNQRREVGYVDFQKGKWRVTGEGMVDHNNALIWDPITLWQPYPYGYLGYYAAIAYRIDKHFEVGTYQSNYQYTGIPAPDHVFDHSATVRIDATNHLEFKVEGHYMNGNGGALAGAAHGFYLFDNPNLQHDTSLLVVRSTVFF